MLNGALVSTFERWREHIIEEKQLKTKALKVMQRLMNGALFLAFESWREHMIEEKQLRSKGLMIVRRLMNGALVPALASWQGYVEAQARFRFVTGRVHKRLRRIILYRFCREVIHTWSLQARRLTLAVQLRALLSNDFLKKSFFRWFHVCHHAQREVKSSVATANAWSSLYSTYCDENPIQHLLR